MSQILTNLSDAEISDDVFKKINTIDELNKFEMLLTNSEHRKKTVKFISHYLKILMFCFLIKIF